MFRMAPTRTKDALTHTQIDCHFDLNGYKHTSGPLDSSLEEPLTPLSSRRPVVSNPPCALERRRDILQP